MTLDELAILHGTDKGSGWAHGLSPKGYTGAYEQLLGGKRKRALRVLEIGVGHGGSLRMWAAYLPKGRVIGLDLRARALEHADPPRIEVVIGDQADPEVLAALAGRGPFDVIVDDGCHRTPAQRASFEALWPALKPGGWYAVEDLHAAPDSIPWLEALGAEFPTPRLAVLVKP